MKKTFVDCLCCYVFVPLFIHSFTESNVHFRSSNLHCCFAG